MTNETKHTPLPWVLALANSNQSETSVYYRPPYGGGGYIEVAKLYEARDNGGCNVPPQEAKANTAFIVRACNAHDDLVAALEPFGEYIKNPSQPIHAVIRKEEWAAVTAALAKAKAQHRKNL